MPYSRIARHYHLLERFTMWNALKGARLAHLEKLAEHGKVRNALLIGEGNGSFLLPFLERYPEAEILVIDSCPEMIKAAKEKLRRSNHNNSKVRFELVDMRQAKLTASQYDVLVTNFFFDNFDQATTTQLVTKLANAAAPEAQWLWSDFKIPEHGWLALRARFWLKVLYLFFGRVASVSVRQLPDAERAIMASGYTSVASKELCGRLLRATHYSKS